MVESNAQSHNHTSYHASVAWEDEQLLGSYIKSHHTFNWQGLPRALVKHLPYVLWDYCLQNNLLGWLCILTMYIIGRTRRSSNIMEVAHCCAWYYKWNIHVVNAYCHYMAGKLNKCLPLGSSRRWHTENYAVDL